VDMRTGSPDPDSPFRALPAAGDSETEILDIEQPPNTTAARVRPAKSRPRPDRFHAAARPARRSPRHSPLRREARSRIARGAWLDPGALHRP